MSWYRIYLLCKNCLVNGIKIRVYVVIVFKEENFYMLYYND